MKNFYLLAIALLLLLFSKHLKAQVKIGNNSTTINSNSLLELESTDKGFVLPRISLLNDSLSSPLGPDLLTGTLVYNVNNGIINGNGRGLYYWNGSRWLAISIKNPLAIIKTWQLVGNSSTNSSLNFLGTTDSAGLSFRTNNKEAVHIDSLQNVSVGTNNTNYKFEEAGTFRMHIDSFNIMHSLDILPSLEPGIRYTGNVFNPDDGGKILNGIASLPGDENVATVGFLNPETFEQSVMSAEKGDINLSTANAAGQSNMDFENGQITARTSSITEDTSNHFEMSNNNINFSREVNGIGKTIINLNDSTIGFNAGEEVANSRITGVNINPANFSMYNNDVAIRQNSNLGINSTGYFFNVADSNLQTNMMISGYANRLLNTVSYTSPQLNTSINMDSTLSLARNSLDQNSGLNIKANNVGLYANHFADNKSAAANLSLDSFNIGLSKFSSFSNFILSNKAASFTSNDSFKVSIGNNIPQANLDVTGSIRSSNLTSGGTVMADNNGILYTSTTVEKSAQNFDYSIPASTTVSSSLLSIVSTTLSTGKLDLTINFPTSLSSTNASVSVWPKQDLPDNVAIAFTRIISTSQMKIRFLNYGTTSQSLSGQIHITVNQF